MVITLIVLGIVVVLVFYVISLYNNLVKLRNRIENAWAQIDVQLKRRWDLIPNLVETVKGYASHEKETLESVIAARNAATSRSSSTTRACDCREPPPRSSRCTSASATRRRRPSSRE